MNKNKIFFIVFFTILGLSVGATYWRIFVARDYVIHAETDCDPTTETCFIYECDPAAEECTGDPEEDTWYYKLITRKAYNIPECDPGDETCEALVCPEGEEDCEEILCTDETKGEDGVCSDPEIYIAEHPEEGEEVAEDPEGSEEESDTDSVEGEEETAGDETGNANADVAPLPIVNLGSESEAIEPCVGSNVCTAPDADDSQTISGETESLPASKPLPEGVQRI